MKVETAKPSPLVSVILPFYNASFLEEAIQSILSQTFNDFELLLIDNGSTDQSQEIAESYTSHPHIRLIKESQRGVVFAANAGIKSSIGKYIARMDADDVALPNRLQCQVEELNSNTSVDVVSGLITYMGDKSNEGFMHYVNWLNSIKTSEEVNLNQFVEFPMANPSMMFRKSLFDRYGMYEEGDFPEDYEFFLRLQSHGIQMTKVNAHILQWRDTEERLTRTDSRYSQDAFFRIKAKYLARWLENHNPFHPNVFLWGAGRLSRRRSNYLLSEGIHVSQYIDVKEGKNIIHFSQVPAHSECFIISYVSNRGARKEIRSFLIDRGYIEGKNYILAS